MSFFYKMSWNFGNDTSIDCWKINLFIDINFINLKVLTGFLELNVGQ